MTNTFGNGLEDGVNGLICGQRGVEDGKVSLEALRDIVAAAARLNHGRQEVDVDNGDEVAGFLQAVETAHLDQLAQELVGALGKQKKK